MYTLKEGLVVEGVIRYVCRLAPLFSQSKNLISSDQYDGLVD